MSRCNVSYLSHLPKLHKRVVRIDMREMNANETEDVDKDDDFLAILPDTTHGFTRNR